MQSVNQKNNSQKTSPKIAIIAGRGELPKIIFDKLGSAFVIGFESDANEVLPADFLGNMGQIGSIVAALKAAEISKIVFAGGIIKPKIKDLKLDKEAAQLLGKMAFTKIFKKLPGDDSLFKMIINYLESHGFAAIGVDEVMPELLAEFGALGVLKPDAQMLENIKLGCECAKKLGKKDLGQAVVYAGGKLIASEDVKGTDNLLERAAKICTDKKVLVKCIKPQQDRRIDLPSIGVHTIEKLAALGFAGVAVEAEHSLIIGKEKVAARADELGVFVWGV